MNDRINFDALFYDGSIEYTIPLEPNPGDNVKFKFRTGKDNVDAVFLCMNQFTYRMNKTYSDKLFSYYEISHRCPDRQMVFHFRIEKGSQICHFDKNGVHYEMGRDYEFSITPGYHTPDWAKGAIMYQIFVDRFNNGDKTNDVENNEYLYIGDGTKHVDDWSKNPSTGADGVREFYGGDLQGVLDKLDYLEKLGIEVIYFNPLFVSPSNHKYDIQDYDYIDPHFGKIVKEKGSNLSDGESDNRKATRYITRVTDKENLEASNAFFAHVVDEIHKRGMKVILDGVFNHCGSFNKWMDKERIYSGQAGYADGAYVSNESPYNKYFNFQGDKWPDNNSYDGWWGYDTLPKLNYEGSEDLYEYIMYIARKWVSPPYNVDGWRLDVAADLGYSQEMNHQFWRDFRTNVRMANPDAIIIAEHYGDPTSWLMGDQWDTVMNYDAFMEPISWFLTGMEKHSDKYQDQLVNNMAAFSMAMRSSTKTFQQQSLLVAMNELSNHDHSRFLTRTNKTVGRTEINGAVKADEGVDKAVLKEAVIMQMTWPGAATIYYGEEAGVCGWTDPDNRRTYPWGHEDVELIEFYREAIMLRKTNRALRYGALKTLVHETGVFGYARMLKDNVIIVLINNNDTEQKVEIPVWQVGGMDNMLIYRIMETTRDFYYVGSIKYDIEDGLIVYETKAKSAVVFKLDMDEIDDVR